MQNVNRDTCKFAVKCSAVCINGEWKDVYKEPITDKGKTSKRGRLTFARWKANSWSDRKLHDYETIRIDQLDPNLHENVMIEIFRDGKILHKSTLDAVRERAKDDRFLQ